jgi:hypothetical protein
MIIVAVELRRGEPVLTGELEGVGDSEPSLLRRIDEEQAAERPERLAAEVGAWFLVDDDHAPPGGSRFRRGHEPGKAPPDHEHVRLVML